MSIKFKTFQVPEHLNGNRRLFLHRPCEYGCDSRDGIEGVGYLSFSTNGSGVVLWVETEEEYKAIESALQYELSH